jgi:hypothetical protein
MAKHFLGSGIEHEYFFLRKVEKQRGHSTCGSGFRAFIIHPHKKKALAPKPATSKVIFNSEIDDMSTEERKWRNSMRAQVGTNSEDRTESEPHVPTIPYLYNTILVSLLAKKISPCQNETPALQKKDSYLLLRSALTVLIFVSQV